MDTQYWTAINHFFIWGSIAIYFVMSLALYSDGIFTLSPTGFPYIGKCAIRIASQDCPLSFFKRMSGITLFLP